MASVIIQEDVRVPLNIQTLADFRRWALSDEFPETGRIDFIQGNIEVDMSPENAYTHGSPKVAIVARLWSLIDGEDIGDLFSDRMRWSSVAGNVSVEPDIIFVSYESLESGRATLVPQSGGADDDFVEIEGPPDLVVEIVSKSSIAKDTRRLPQAYFTAGVTEFWLVDARKEVLLFKIHRRDQSGFAAQKVDQQGFQSSPVLNRRFRLDRSRGRRGQWKYNLRVEPQTVDCATG